MRSGDLRWHVDQPAGPLVVDFPQTFAGWIAAAEPLDAARVVFTLGGEPVPVQWSARADVEQALPGCHALGWRFTPDRRAMLDSRLRALSLSAMCGERPIFRRAFLKSRNLLPPGRDGPLYFLHIPKTGGTALRHIVSNAFGNSPHLLVYRDEIGVPRDDVAALPEAFLRSREFLFGHFDCSLAPLALEAEPKIVVVLREPSQMIRSYLDFEPAPPARFLDNPQVRHLCGIAYSGAFGDVTRQHLEHAMERIERHAYVVSQHKLQQFAGELSDLFGLAPFEVGRVNETTRPVPPPPRPLSVDLRHDTELFAACGDRRPDFLAFLNR